MTRNLIPLPPPEPAVNDAALLGRCAHGDHAALAELFQIHHRPVYRFLCRLAGPGHPDLDDLAQQTFVTAWRCADSFGGRGSVRSWLFGIAANTLRQHRRTERRRFAALTRFWRRPAPAQTGVDEHVASRQDLGRLQAALERVPHDQRVAFVLCEIEGLSGAEVAEILNVPTGTVWRRVHQARKKLKGELQRGLT